MISRLLTALSPPLRPPVQALASVANRCGPWPLLAATLPTALAYYQPLSATLLTQRLAVARWGVVVAALLEAARLHRSTGPLLAALRRLEADGLGVSSTTVAGFLFGMAKSGSLRKRSALQ